MSHRDDLIDDLARSWRDSPAFPTAAAGAERYGAGLSRREYVAARALQGALANPELAQRGDGPDRAVKLALSAADLLLARLYGAGVAGDSAAVGASDDA